MAKKGFLSEGRKKVKKKPIKDCQENQRRENSDVRTNRSTWSKAAKADVRSAERKKEAEWSERKLTLAVTCAFPPWLAGVWHRSQDEARTARRR